MVSYEAFACRCGAGDVVLFGKTILDVNFFMERGTSPSSGRFSWSFNDSKLFSRAFNDSNYSPGPSTPPSYSTGPSRNAECANCKLLIGKLQVLEATLEMNIHPEKHTIDSTALLYELYNDMRKFSFE
ncbi:hypothetical protein Tco_1272774 [Tanacetum coccineum]